MKFLFFLLAASIMVNPAFARNSAMTAALLRANGACFPLNSSWTPQWASLQGYWKLDDASGATAPVDSSANASAATTANVTFGVTGRISTAATFNGSTSYVRIPATNASLSATTDSSFTLAAWAYINSFPPDACATNSSTCKGLIFGRYGYHMGLMVQNAGTLAGEYFVSGPTFRTKSAGAVSTGRWYHFAMVVNDTAKTVQMYINGAAAGTAGSYAGLTLNVYGTLRPFMIGKADYTAALTNGNNAYPFDGTVDEAAVWSTALTAAEIRTIYDQQSCGKN